MASEKEVTDSPTAWVNKHIQEYVTSNGERGQFQKGVPPSLLLTTTGRKTGVLRRTGLFYEEDNGRYVIVASKGGADDHPAWCHNLVANPDVGLQVGPEIFPARAHVAEGDERARLWNLMCASFPTYESFQSKTTREIPIVVLERISLESCYWIPVGADETSNPSRGESCTLPRDRYQQSRHHAGRAQDPLYACDTSRS